VNTTPVFAQWFETLDERAKEHVSSTIGFLRNEGPTLGRPYADTLKGSRFANMKELRVNANRMAIRIAFAFDPRRRAILLVAGDKRGVNEQRFYRQLIAKADSLLSAYLKR
jgi:hypothetical protein